jgi:hypothetical protein
MRPDITAAIRAQFIAAIERRAATLDGEPRRVLEVRLSELRSSDIDALADAPAAHRPSPAAGTLGELAHLLARAAGPDRAAYPDIPALAGLRQLWSTLRADDQLRQSVAHDPINAGPLNSTALASRAIALMHELSPGYLRSFLAYVDDLAWLEELDGAGSANASNAATTKKRIGRKPRA